jgi:hypothetical protein
MDKQTARRRKAARQQAAAPAAAPQALNPDDHANGAEMDLGDSTTGQALAAGDEIDEAMAAQMAEKQRAADDQRQAQLDAFAAALAKKRQSAVNARAQSNIEQIWREDEEFYEGIDDANRNEHATLKPRDFGGTGGTSVADNAARGTGSNVFPNITRPYVDFSAGRAADMLLPTDDPNWDLRETPMPDIIEAMGSDKPLTYPPGVIPKDGAPTTIGEAATQMVGQARAKVAKAKRRIEDWLEEGHYSAEQRKVLKDAAKVGVGILKGPFPIKRMARVIQRDDAGVITGMAIQNKTAPVSKRIDYWNFYPDPACGENIHRGNYVWERDTITARELRDLLGTVGDDDQPFYLEETIKQCLSEGPQRKYQEDLNYQAQDAESFEIWYYHGVATAEDLRAAGLDVKEDTVLPVMITMVNDRVIKAARSTLDSGEFPYDVMVWQERDGHWAGIGVARQVRTPQRMLTAATRNLLDNAGLAAGPQIVIADGAIKPMNPNEPYGIRPRMLWKMLKDATNIDDVRKAFAAITIPMLTDELLKIVAYAQKLAEDCTGMPMLMQGQQGQASETVGGMQLLTNNSNTPLRQIAKLFDDRITVPHLLRYYEWLLIYGEQDEKGEYVVAARGSSALFERDAQNQAILAMGQLIGNPAFAIDPMRWIKQYMKAQRLDPDNFQYSQAEQAQMKAQAAQNPPPQDPKIQVAQIGAQARVKAAEIAAGVQEKRIAADTDRDAVFAQSEAARTQADAQAHQSELQTKLQLAYLDYANREKLSLDQVKSRLAETTMKLNVQRELSEMSTAADLHKHNNPTTQAITPPTEPAGRAPSGEAWQA